MDYFIQHATVDNLETIMQIYSKARMFMESHGNPTQWGKSYPEEEMLQRDIARNVLYTVCDTAGIHGVFYYEQEEDPTYEIITEGSWSSTMPYGVIHRVAGDGSGGILKAVIQFAAEKSGYLRIDTHSDNYVMQKALTKYGFQKCGIIFVEDGSPRIAFDKVNNLRGAQNMT